MVARIADVRTEVVHQGRIFEPLAFPIGQPVARVWSNIASARRATCCAWPAT